MKTLNEVYIEVLQEGLKAAKMISDVNNKALAYAELAKSIAMTGVITTTTDIEKKEVGNEKEIKNNKEIKEIKESKKETKTAKKVTVKKEEKKNEKDCLLPENTKTAVPEDLPEVQETTVKETVVEETQDAWTEENQKQYEEQLSVLNQYVESWGEEYVYQQCIPAFFENAEIVGAEYVRPSNIQAFVEYLYMIATQE